MGHYNEKVQTAINELVIRRAAFHRAEENAQKSLKLVLEDAGEHGVSLAPVDCIEHEYIALAEYEPQTFLPITAIRYWNGKLEVFMQDYEPKCGGWEFLPSGSWIEYESAHPDTHFILDLVIENLEWADGYQDEDIEDRGEMPWDYGKHFN